MNERTFHASGAHRLEDPERRKWLPPDDLVRQLELQPGMAVVDIGAGTGYFALPIAEAVRPGTLYAVDLQQEMLARLEAKLVEADLTASVRLVQGDAAATGLPDACADRVLIANVWHELDDHAGVLREAARLLRSGGRLAILDWRADVSRPPGPPPEHRISVETVVGTLKGQGWPVMSSGAFGSYSYLVLAEPPPQRGG